MRIFFVIAGILAVACQPARKSASTISEQDPVLFTVGDSSVYASEFIYVYEKNNAQFDSAFTRGDVSSYLKLYENFKVKIREAYALGLDSLESYREELATYTDQLKQPYLTETRVTDELIDEAYARFGQEVRASHILILIPKNPSPDDTLKAYNEISEIRQRAVNGAPFDSLAYIFSQDPSAKENRGHLGYFTSMQMVYEFEDAAYRTPVGDISPIIRSSFGYHILKVFDRRPTNGTVTVSHLMLRLDNDSTAVRNRIFEIHDMAVGGVEWTQLVKEYSEDVNTAGNKGLLNPFKVNDAPFDFQEAAFSLNEIGDISDPVRTKFGWHILRLEDRQPIASKEEMTPMIQRRIRQDSRADMGRKVLVKRLKEEWGFQENPEVRNLLNTYADSTLNTGNWKKTTIKDTTTILFSVGKKEFSSGGFGNYLQGNQQATVTNPSVYISEKYEEFQEDRIIEWEADHLEDKYPEYRMLLREYKEGILYFKLMEDEIWKKASADTAGQRSYYEMHAGNYTGTPTAGATVYALRDSMYVSSLGRALASGDDGMLELIKTEYQADLHTPLLPVEVEWSQGEESPWKSVPMTEGVYNRKILDKWYVIHVTNVENNAIKPFEKVRGLVISDYQKYLEEKWVEQLKTKYPVNRNEAGVNYVYERLVR